MMTVRSFTLFIVLLLLSNRITAQLCQGSLGDPIINITFGSGGNPGAALPAVATNYNYITTDCPDDGNYTVRNNTTACFGNTWHTLSSDHTGDAGGYFMLVNASFQPGAFYTDTVKGLCGNTTYEFAAWITNVLLPTSCNGNPIKPNLTFNIEKKDGTVLQTYNTGDIASTSSPLWKQYGFYFTTPVGGTDVVLRIVNNAPGGCGNDLALDDITFRPCGPQITASVNGNPATPTAFCEGTAHTYSLQCSTSGGFNNPVFQWQYLDPASTSWIDIAAANTNNYTVNFAANAAPGKYQYRLAVAESGNIGSLQCRIYSQPFVFTINPNPVTTAGNNGPVCTSQPLTLTASGGTQYSWTGPNGFTGSGSPLVINSIQLNQAGQYNVVVTTAAGCSKSDLTNVIINPLPVAGTSFTTASICKGDSVQFIATGGPGYQWIPATGLSNAGIYNPKASPAITTTYSVIVSNQFSCKDTADIIVTVSAGPIADAGPDKIMLKGHPVQLSGQVTGTSSTYSWSPATYIDDIHSLQPVVAPPADTKYILKAVSTIGCGISFDTTLVKVYNDIYIPNAFTPNGDGRNDVWNIPALGAFTSFELVLYNRWGQPVFETKDTPRQWDGTYKGSPCLAGAYNYFIKTGNRFIKGTVLLLR